MRLATIFPCRVQESKSAPVTSTNLVYHNMVDKNILHQAGSKQYRLLTTFNEKIELTHCSEVISEMGQVRQRICEVIRIGREVNLF